MNNEYITYEEFQREQELDNYNRVCGMNMNQSRENMISQIKQYKFSITDLAQYLDTHPDDRRALAMHREYCNKYRMNIDQYQKLYGPLTIMFPCNKWRWIEEPWPWERGNY